MPEISVIIPVCNVEEYLVECLDSIKKQEFGDFEAICVNDASEDRSEEILKKYCNDDSRFKLITLSQRGGLSKARNAGIDSCQGRYICFLDSDDVLRDGMLETIHRNMKENRYDLFCFDAGLIYDPSMENDPSVLEKKRLFKRMAANYSEAKDGTDLIYQMLLRGEYSSPVWLYALSHDFINRNDIRFEEGIINEDTLYSVECYLRAKRVGYVHKELYGYRIRRGSLSDNKNNSYWLYSSVKVWFRHLALLEEYSLSEKASFVLKSILEEDAQLIRRLNFLLGAGNEHSSNRRQDFADYLMKGAGLGEYEKYEIDYCLYEKGFLSELNDAGLILLYGSGYWGDKCRLYLRKNNLESKLFCFLDSADHSGKIKKGEVFVYGINQISSLWNSNKLTNALVIIATDEKYHDEIEETCKMHSIEKIIRLDKRLQAIVEYRLRHR